jgi:hypothetical protein
MRRQEWATAFTLLLTTMSCKIGFVFLSYCICRRWNQVNPLVKEEAQGGGNCKMGGPTNDNEGGSLRWRRRALPFCNSRQARAFPNVIPRAGKTLPINTQHSHRVPTQLHCVPCATLNSHRGSPSFHTISLHSQVHILDPKVSCKHAKWPWQLLNVEIAY